MTDALKRGELTRYISATVAAAVRRSSPRDQSARCREVASANPVAPIIPSQILRTLLVVVTVAAILAGIWRLPGGPVVVAVFVIAYVVAPVTH